MGRGGAEDAENNEVRSSKQQISNIECRISKSAQAMDCSDGEKPGQWFF